MLIVSEIKIKKNRDKVSIAIASSNFIFLVFLGLPQGSIYVL